MTVVLSFMLGNDFYKVKTCLVLLGCLFGVDVVQQDEPGCDSRTARLTEQRQLTAHFGVNPPWTDVDLLGTQNQ